MPTQRYTKINVTEAKVQLRKNSYPTLEPIKWGTFASDNSRTVNLDTAGTYDAASNTVWFLGGTDKQVITGRKNAINKVDGAGGNDTITGGDLNDWLYGGDGDDSLSGGAGDDRLSGGAGNDTVSGGAGNDFIYGDDGNDSLLGDAGNDTLNGGLGSDTMDGGKGADVLFGGDGNDSMNGGDDADILYGDAGNDKLFGDAGNDTLVGGTGADTLTGGRGRDAFVFNLGDSNDNQPDTITDFALGFDKLWIDWANYSTTVIPRAPLVVGITQKGNDAELTFNFNADKTGVDYRIILKSFSVNSLGTGATFQKNITDMFTLFDASKVTYPNP